MGSLDKFWIEPDLQPAWSVLDYDLVDVPVGQSPDVRGDCIWILIQQATGHIVVVADGVRPGQVNRGIHAAATALDGHVIAGWVPRLLGDIELDCQAVVNTGVAHGAELRGIGTSTQRRDSRASSSHGGIRFR